MRIVIPQEKKLVHEMILPIRWGDMDALGHLNNVAYFRYLETARMDWLRSIGCESDARGEGVVLVNAFFNYHRQLEYPGDVRLRMYVSDPGRSSFESWATLERGDVPGVVHAAGGGTIVWVDYAREKSLPLPPALRAAVS